MNSSSDSVILFTDQRVVLCNELGCHFLEQFHKDTDKTFHQGCI
jgi:hypothetical protein